MTRMHSSMMRTVRSSGRPGGCLLRGVSAPRGACLVPGGVSAPGGGSAPRRVCSGGVSALSAPGGGGIPACTEADPIPFGQTHACKNITFATSLRTVKILKQSDTH